MDLEDCILLREEAVDSNSLNRCITNIFNLTKELASGSVSETSENYPESPFYKDGYDNALTGSPEYAPYGLTSASVTSDSAGVVQRTYSGPLNMNVYRRQSLSSNSATGYYEYGMETVSNNFVPTVETLYSPTYPLVFSSLLGGEDNGPFANGTCTIESDFLPTVKYTSYLLCSGFGVSFGTITFSANDGMAQENSVQIDVTNDLIHMKNVDEIIFVSVSNGYGSGVKRVSENMDMVEDVCSTEITYLDKRHNSILLRSITKNDASDSIRIDKGSGRILEDGEEAEYGTYVKLDNSEYSLNFFVVFTYSLPDVEFSNDAIGLGSDERRTSYAKFQQNVMEIDGTPLTLPKFRYLDTFDQDENPTNKVKDVESAFENAENAEFPALSSISSTLRNGKSCFKGCKSATFSSLPGISLPKAVTVESMFEGCDSATFDSLTGVYLPTVSKSSYMFYGCANSRFGELLSLNTCGDASRMFYGCPKATFSKLTSIEGNAASISEMFRGCDGATFRLMSSLHSGYSGQTNAASAFMMLENATFDALTSIGMGGLGYSSQSMFEGCRSASFSKLSSISGNGDGGNGPVDARRMFYGCSNGTFGNLHSLGGLIRNSSEMFRGCRKLNLSITDTLNSLNSAGYMFAESKSVSLSTLGRSLYDGEGMFYGTESVAIRSFGDRVGGELPMNATMKNAFANAGSVAICGDVFANNSDMYGMFDSVGTLELGSSDGGMFETDSNTACRRMDYMFRNVTSPNVFVKYIHSIFPKNLASASYMFYSGTRNTSDGIFDVDVYNNRGIERILSRTEENRTVDTLRDSNVTDTSYMFANRHISGDKATRFFNNVEYNEGGMPPYSRYSMHIPHAVEKADGMYENVTVGGNEALTSAILMIPPSLTSANRMFYHSAELSASGIPMVFASDTSSRNYKSGFVYFSDKLADNHTDWMKGVRFANVRGEECDLTLSVKNLSSDYFEGSDFTFDCFSHIIDRSGVYWSDGNKNYTFFCGNSETPRELHFSGLKDDISRWFTEGCEFANILAPYSAADSYGYTLRKDMTAQLPDGISKTFMKLYSGDIERISQYTNDVDLDSLSGLDGDNMTCMFCLPMLSKYSVNFRYLVTDGVPAEYLRGGVSRVYGNDLCSITISANRSSTESYCDNDSYSNVTFKGLTHISSVNMPFAFCNLQSATFENVQSIGGNLANSICAFANCKNATFDSLTSIRINAKYTNDTLTSNSFVLSTKTTEWNNLFYRMFDGCDMAAFPNLCSIYVNGASNVVMDSMFRNSGLAHVPNVDITANGAVYCGGKSFSLYEADADAPSITGEWANGGSSPAVTFEQSVSQYLPHRSGDSSYGLIKLSLNSFNAVSWQSLSSVISFSLPENVTSITVPCSCNLYPSQYYEYVEVFGVKEGGTPQSIGKFSGSGLNTATWSSTGDGDSLSGLKIVHYSQYYAGNGVVIPYIKMRNASGEEFMFRNFEFKKDGDADTIECKALKAARRPVDYTENELKPNDHIAIRGSFVDAASAYAESATKLSSVSVLSNSDIFVNYMFARSNVGFSEGCSVNISSEGGSVNARGMFSGCSGSTFSDLTELNIRQSEGVKRDSVRYPNYSTMGVAGMFENCQNATLENLTSLRLPRDYDDNMSQHTYDNMFNGCAYRQLNLSALSLSSTNIHRLGWNNNRTNGNSLFGTISGIDNLDRDAAIKKLHLDRSIACCMDWSSTPTTAQLVEDGLQSYNTNTALKNVQTINTNFCYYHTDIDNTTGMFNDKVGGFNSVGVKSNAVSASVSVSGFPNGNSISEIYIKFDGTEPYSASTTGNIFTIIHKNNGNPSYEVIVPEDNAVSGNCAYRYVFRHYADNYDDFIGFLAKSYSDSYGLYMFGLRVLSEKQVYQPGDGFTWEVVDWIETDGGAVIDTLYVPGYNTTVKMRCILYDSPTSTEWGYFGCSGTTDNRFYVKNKTTNSQIVAAGGSTESTSIQVTKNPRSNLHGLNGLYESDNILEIIYSANMFSSLFAVNSLRDCSAKSTTFSNGTAFSCSRSMSLFALHYDSSQNEYQNMSKMRLYGCEIWEDNVLRRRFIPVRKYGTSTYALYDSVEGRIYDSVTSTKFTGGSFT